jgi:hypothetical protein
MMDEKGGIMVAVVDNRCDSGSIPCLTCGNEYVIIYNREDMMSWLSGKDFIQDAMPYLSANERELLLSRTCGECFDKMFPPDLDSDE